VQSFDQLHLPRMVNRVAGDAEDEIETLGVCYRRLPLADVRDEGGQPLLFGLDRASAPLDVIVCSIVVVLMMSSVSLETRLRASR